MGPLKNDEDLLGGLLEGLGELLEHLLNGED
jgi:hypothetical protein